MRKLRFATQTGGAPTAEEWLARAKRIEGLGYSTLAMPDHMVGGAWAALPALAALAPVTTTLRLGTLVIDNDFRNPVVLASSRCSTCSPADASSSAWARGGSTAITRARGSHSIAAACAWRAWRRR